MRTLRSIGMIFLFTGALTAAGFGWAQHQHEQKPQDKDRDRWMWQLPRHVIDSIGVKPGMVVADVGAGDGCSLSL
jgi:hypothetical protein